MATTYGGTRRDLIGSLGELVHAGTATGASASTLIDTGTLNHNDDHFNGLLIYIWGTGITSQEREITDFVQSTSTITVNRAWTGGSPVAPNYEIYTRRFNGAAYTAALNQALRLLQRNLLLPDEDVTLTLGDPSLAASYSYTVPTGMVSIWRILREDISLDGVYTVPVPGPNDSSAPWWYLSQDGSTFKIVLDREAHLASGWIVEGRKLKVIGQKRETWPTSEISSLTVNVGPVIELAAHILQGRDIKDEQLFPIYLNRLAEALKEIGTAIWPGSVIVDDS